MKKLIIALGLIFSATLVQAQPPQGQQPPSIEERLKRSNEVLQPAVQPNAEQKKAIETANKRFFTAADKIMGNKPPDTQKVQKQLETLEKERDDAIKKVLTAAQFKKYEAAAKGLKPAKPSEKRGEGPPPPKNN